MKKTAFAAAVMSIVMTAPYAYAGFSDIGDHWANRFITKLTDSGVVEGYDGRYRPDDPVNVDEFLKIVLGVMGEEIIPYGQNWADAYIKRALEIGIIENGEFDSFKRPVTREEIARICTRAIDADEVTGEMRERLIAGISDYYDIYNSSKEYVLAAYANRLLNGYSDNSFRAGKNATRAEAAVIACRMTDTGSFAKKGSDAADTDISDSFYVSPDGDDKNSGQRNAPFKTAERAIEAIRTASASGGYPERGITVYFYGGEYRITKSIALDAQHSGKEGAPVVFTAVPGEKVRFTGGEKLSYSDFKAISSDMASKLLDKNAAKNVLELDLKKQGIEDLGVLSRRGFLITANITPQAELYIDKNRAQLARWPNSEWVGTTEIVRSGARSQNGVLEGAVFKIDYDRPTKWKTNINEIYTSGVLGPNYFYGYFPIEKIAPGEITLKEGSVTSYYSKHFIKYENIFEETDEPGEYYIDRQTGMLYLYPPAGFSKDSDIRLSLLGENMITGSNVDNITFKNIAFDSSREGIARITGNNICFENCEISGTGTNGIYLNGTGCSVRNCIIHDIGSTGISMNGGDYENRIPNSNVIENNHIYRAAQIERSYQAGITLGYRSVGTRVSHNEIHSMPHAAMIVYGPDHLIEYNDIYDAVREFHDMDAIYLNVYQYPWERNVVIKGNYFHDFGNQNFTEKQMNISAIRTDNNGNGINVVENIFYNIGYDNSNGIRAVCAQGIDNVVDRNIFIDCAGTFEGAHTYNPDAKWDITSDSVKPIYDQWKIFSPKYSEQNPEVLDFYNHHFASYEKNNSFKDNLVVNIAFGLSTLLREPAKDGFDAAPELVSSQNNIVQKSDPGFYDYKGHNFEINATSEVYKNNPNILKPDFENIGIPAGAAVGAQ